jgi:hypothetical protein
METEFEINGRKFKLNKIDAFKQTHILKRMAPILSELVPHLKEISKDAKEPEKITEADSWVMLSKLLGPAMTGLSKLSDADSDFVLHNLLASVEVQQSSGNWAKVSTPTMLMMQDLELPMITQIASKAFMFNCSGFFFVPAQK